ncbi:hypothetical protein EJ02DRAFT_469589 [Clathrospora elynae]|uniref:Uncharacterized protein n=1 Tax=Clathrospora elynae TaxID=706981 RepID=A0A6A5SGF0_9PLEO|nr:hypothetical protein EJ02DRAFT_469589 [Clathrospora elynae]
MVQTHVYDHFQQQGNQLLYLIYDSMIVEDPDERSSADHCHDEAQKLLLLLLNTDILTHESYHGDGASAVPRSDGSQTRIKGTVKEMDSKTQPRRAVNSIESGSVGTPTHGMSHGGKKHEAEDAIDSHNLHALKPKRRRLKATF